LTLNCVFTTSRGSQHFLNGKRIFRGVGESAFRYHSCSFGRIRAYSGFQVAFAGPPERPCAQTMKGYSHAALNVAGLSASNCAEAEARRRRCGFLTPMVSIIGAAGSLFLPPHELRMCLPTLALAPNTKNQHQKASVRESPRRESIDSEKHRSVARRINPHKNCNRSKSPRPMQALARRRTRRGRPRPSAVVCFWSHQRPFCGFHPTGTRTDGARLPTDWVG